MKEDKAARHPRPRYGKTRPDRAPVAERQAIREQAKGARR